MIEDDNTVRTHVNRVIAHIDWNVAAGLDEAPGPVEIEAVERALSHTRNVMKYIATKLHLPELDYTEARIDGDISKLHELFRNLARESGPRSAG